MGVGTFDSLVGAAFALFLLLNTIGVGIMIFFDNLLGDLGGLGSLVTIIFLPISALLPPCLLLKKHRHKIDNDCLEIAG